MAAFFAVIFLLYHLNVSSYYNKFCYNIRFLVILYQKQALYTKICYNLTEGAKAND